MYSCSGSLNKRLPRATKSPRAGIHEFLPETQMSLPGKCAVPLGTHSCLMYGQRRHAQVGISLTMQHLPPSGIPQVYTLRSGLCLPWADLLRLSPVPLGCPPAGPAQLRECPRPGGAGQAPETSPSCCAQFQGSQGLARCPWRLPALAPAFGTSWKNPGGPAPIHSPACLNLPPRPMRDPLSRHTSNSRVHPSILEQTQTR